MKQVAAALLCGLLVVGCSAGAAPTPEIIYITPAPVATPTATPTPVVVATPEPTPTPTPEPVVATPAPKPTPPPWHKASAPVILASGAGDSYLIAGGYKNFGSTCGYATAGTGNTFIAAVVMYKAGTDSLFYSSGEWTLHDASSTQYEPSFDGYACLADTSKLLATGTLNPGLQVIGVVFFEVPAKAKHLYIDWRSTMSFPSQIETWRMW